MEAALAANSITVKRSGQTVLNDVSFQVAAGDVYALLGGNGAGKSTTLLNFLGFLSPDTGTVEVLGDDVGANLKDVRLKIAYLPEAATLYPHLNAYENISYFLSLAKATADQGAIDAALDRGSLKEGARSNRLDTYSKGMRQKVAIALALLRDAPVLLLDEPTSGLDPVAIDEFNALVRSLAEEKRTVLMVTHDVYGACQIADRIGLLKDGELVGAFDRPQSGQIDTEQVHAAFAGRSGS